MGSECSVTFPEPWGRKPGRFTAQLTLPCHQRDCRRLWMHSLWDQSRHVFLALMLNNLFSCCQIRSCTQILLTSHYVDQPIHVVILVLLSAVTLTTSVIMLTSHYHYWYVHVVIQVLSCLQPYASVIVFCYFSLWRPVTTCCWHADHSSSTSTNPS